MGQVMLGQDRILMFDQVNVPMATINSTSSKVLAFKYVDLKSHQKSKPEHLIWSSDKVYLILW
jgi:hypothetical protein